MGVHITQLSLMILVVEYQVIHKSQRVCIQSRYVFWVWSNFAEKSNCIQVKGLERERDALLELRNRQEAGTLDPGIYGRSIYK